MKAVKWMTIAGVVLVLVLVAALAVVPAAFAQGPGSGYGPGNGPMHGDGYGPAGPALGGTNSVISLVAEQLGIDRFDLMAQLMDGATVADLAADNGVDLDALVDAVVAARADRLNAAVDAGQLTEEDAQARLETMRAQLTERFTQEWTMQSRLQLHADDMLHLQMHNYADADGDGICDNMNGAGFQGMGMRGRAGR